MNELNDVRAMIKHGTEAMIDRRDDTHGIAFFLRAIATLMLMDEERKRATDGSTLEKVFGGEL